MIPKKELTFVLPYLGKLLLDLKIRLRRTIERNLPYCKLKVCMIEISQLGPLGSGNEVDFCII